MMRHVIVALFAFAAIACHGGDTGPTAPDASAGPATSITICGSTTQPTEPCGGNPGGLSNEIQIRVNSSASSGAAACPCFTFSLLNQTFNDLNAPAATYGIIGLRQGTYQVSGQARVANVFFSFAHNATLTAIGVTPSSIQSLSGPVSSGSQSCSIGYFVPFGGQLPANFSFQFTVATAASGGTC